MSELSYLALYAALFGVVVHLSVFITGEWHLRVAGVVTIHSLVLVLMAFWSSEPIPKALLPIFILFSSYLLGLFGSITVYRLFFHRLRRFPGPRLAALTKLWHVYQCRDSRNHMVLDALHKQYGTFVRTGKDYLYVKSHPGWSHSANTWAIEIGPEEITIFHPGVFEFMDGAGNRNTRAEWYDLIHPLVSPVFSRTSEDHRVRRQIWNQALSHKAIQDYLPRITAQVDVLEQVISTYGTQPVPLNDVMMWFAFDSMGEFAFNQSFDMMKTGKWHEVIKQQRSALSLLGPMNPAVWAMRFGFAFAPFVPATSPELPDVAHWLIKEYESTEAETTKKGRENLLVGNAATVIVGGSDTIGPSLISILYFLALYPEYADGIFHEIDTVDISDTTLLAKLPLLNGFINEAMRLIPAALTMGTRITPPEGLKIDGTWIPGGTRIAGPRYTIFRMERAFVQPLEFIPERWHSRPELVRDKQAFAPFGVGKLTSLIGQVVEHAWEKA
ncbi:putative Tryprostatin B 6-hydroxylase [Seiridium cardinale]|uniref:Tryprostatin B 6-hydroxylase n=1 Tax=Seiridium cardinale TaxID=138064 RepID=A0ABR2XV42_9PEZI